MLAANFTGPGEEIEIENELWMYDYGQRLQITGLALPETFEVHFAWKDREEALVQTGATVDGISTVDIPNIALAQRSAIKAYIYLSTPEDGETTNLITMYVNKRAKPAGFEIPEDIDLFHHTLAVVAEYQRLADTACCRTLVMSSVAFSVCWDTCSSKPFTWAFTLLSDSWTAVLDASAA